MQSAASGSKKDTSSLSIPVLKAHLLGIDVVRGYARLCDLALMSRADIYDAKMNPTGTQRDLSPKHARDAYEYVKSEEIAFWPEVFLALRDPRVATVSVVDVQTGFATLDVSMKVIREVDQICISRVDGNHRLHFADGLSEGYPPIEKVVSFCLALDMTPEKEIKLFRDINDNQRRMNTSHLDNIKTRLTAESELIARDPMLFIANRLKNAPESPLSGLVYDGGRTDITKFIPLRTLKTGLEYMFSRPTRLTALDDRQAQAIVVMNYFSALKRWQPEAWKHPKDYLLLRGAGLWGACFLGAEIIDRALAKGNYKPDDMVRILKSGPAWDWSQAGPFKGLSGRAGALRIRDMIVADLIDDKGVSLKSVLKQISDNL